MSSAGRHAQSSTTCGRALGTREDVFDRLEWEFNPTYLTLWPETWVGEANTSAAPLSVEDYTEEDTDEALGSVVAVPKLEFLSILDMFFQSGAGARLYNDEVLHRLPFPNDTVTSYGPAHLGPIILLLGRGMHTLQWRSKFVISKVRHSSSCLLPQSGVLACLSLLGTGNCLPPLSVLKTAPIASLDAARYMISSSFSFGAVSIGSFRYEISSSFEGYFAPEYIENHPSLCIFFRVIEERK
ncbi:hypothetical protein Tco_0032349 [Tanacetum coccineum]